MSSSSYVPCGSDDSLLSSSSSSPSSSFFYSPYSTQYYPPVDMNSSSIPINTSYYYPFDQYPSSSSSSSTTSSSSSSIPLSFPSASTTSTQYPSLPFDNWIMPIPSPPFDGCDLQYYPSYNQPSNDVVIPTVQQNNAIEKKKTRKPFDRSFRHSEKQTRVMKAIFSKIPYPHPSEYRLIAEKSGLQYKQVRAWFQNTRAKESSSTKKQDPITNSTDFIQMILEKAFGDGSVKKESEYDYLDYLRIMSTTI